jgi:hypothetical protein
MFVFCECCVLSGRSLCDGLITRPQESYRMWCVAVRGLETSRMRRSWPASGRSATEKKSEWNSALLPACHRLSLGSMPVSPARFVVDKAAVRQGFLRVLPFPPVSVILPMFHTHLHNSLSKGRKDEAKQP